MDVSTSPNEKLPRECPQCGGTYPENDRFCPNDGAVLILRGAPTDIVGTVLRGTYRVERLIGSGAMGQVYQVRHLRLEQLRALKLMRNAALSNPTNVERFRREARQQGRIRHPNVATVYDFEEDSDGSYFLVMEFVDGRSLGDLLASGTPLAVARTATLVSQIAAALDAAHEEGIVHRDLKPDNVLVTTGRDGSDRAKVVDFGIATLIESPEESLRITTTGYLVGTPRYMSPEQLMPENGVAVDGRSDVYSLGLLTIEMLLGTLPFGTKNLADVLLRATQPPPKISELSTAVKLPVTLDAVMERALAPERENRYSTAGEFGRDFVFVLSQAGLTPSIDRLPSPTPLGGAAQRSTPANPPATQAPRASRWPEWAAAAAAALAIAAFSVWRLSAGRSALPAVIINDSTSREAAIAPAPIARPPKVDSVPSAPPKHIESRSSAEMTPLAAKQRLDELEQLPTPANAETANRRVRELKLLIPRLQTRRDSVAAEWLSLESFLVLDDTASVCARMPRLSKMSVGTTWEQSVSVWNDSLPCKKRAK
jgi:serine/threonine-protein kinase